MKLIVLAILLCAAYSVCAQNCYLITNLSGATWGKTAFYRDEELRGKIERKLEKNIDKDDTCVMYSVLAYDATSEIHETIVMVLIKDETGKVRSSYFKYQVITDKGTNQRRTWIEHMDALNFMLTIRKCKLVPSRG